MSERGEALHRPTSRLQFTTEERASPELAPYIKKSEKRADKLDAAKEALPQKRVLTKETVYDAARGRAVNKLHFEKVEKDPPKLKPGPRSGPLPPQENSRSRAGKRGRGGRPQGGRTGRSAGRKGHPQR